MTLVQAWLLKPLEMLVRACLYIVGGVFILAAALIGYGPYAGFIALISHVLLTGVIAGVLYILAPLNLPLQSADQYLSQIWHIGQIEHVIPLGISLIASLSIVVWGIKEGGMEPSYGVHSYP